MWTFLKYSRKLAFGSMIICFIFLFCYIQAITTKANLGAQEPQKNFIDENFNKMFGSSEAIYEATWSHSHA